MLNYTKTCSYLHDIKVVEKFVKVSKGANKTMFYGENAHLLNGHML